MKPIIETRMLGKWRVHAIQAGGQKLDGGAMFGVVPKPLWERRIPADERNRIQLGMRCLLVEHERGPILIDNGVGNKESPKFHDIYGVENAATAVEGRTWLEDALRQLGVAADDIVMMIDTHLHFDHAGGNTYQDAEGQVHLSFPRARYVVQRAEYLWATNTNERTAASYFPHNFAPVMDAGRLELVEGEVGIVPGITLMPTPGHTPGHQSVRLDSGGETALFLADLVPTAAHLPLPWIMGYDVEPLVTLETKRRILRTAVEHEWLLVFEHDATMPWGRAVHDGKAYGLASVASGG
ncbi:MAG TPA: MBL fold metallo-hydrolase [Gemmatimonadaceae bacterium]|nr:MBL fold metallo-hydrolase [Gemmatimonadaceae bacterium]